MTTHPRPPPPAAIIFSDLDGTLLDHDSYAFAPAMPALRAVQNHGIPLILTTSKTLAETADVNQAIGNRQAVIVENGCALCFPLGLRYPFELAAHETLHDHAIVRLSPPYHVVRDFIERQRALHGFRLRGFGDMDAAELAELTGLDDDSAGRALQRLCGEPFLWLDSAARFERFHAAARQEGLTITKGGRFHHLMGQTDKADALRAMRLLFAVDNPQRTPVVALGDSENDRHMLEAADIAVAVKRHDGTHLLCHGIKRTLLTKRAGPEGWNAAVLQILDELDELQRPRVVN